jgi:hypothetical protein
LKPSVPSISSMLFDVVGSSSISSTRIAGSPVHAPNSYAYA